MEKNYFLISNNIGKMLVTHNISKKITYCLVDIKDIPRLRLHQWKINVPNGVHAKIKNEFVKIGNFILDEYNCLVKFENKNKYDFRKNNLQIPELPLNKITLNPSEIIKLRLLDVDYIMSILDRDRQKQTVSSMMSI